MRQKIDTGLTQYNFLLQSINQLAEDKAKYCRRLGTLAEAQKIVQEVSVKIQQTAHEEIIKVVSLCMSSVFDEPYKFQIQFVRRRGKTEAELVFERDGLILDPLTASGGGIVDVASFALRLACLLLSKPNKRKLIILDEPFKFVSAKYHEKLKCLLEELSKQFGIQFVIVTHIPALMTGTVIEL
jgi:DNA repair exonuclease SbcCD ATPase subunit